MINLKNIYTSIKNRISPPKETIPRPNYYTLFDEIDEETLCLEFGNDILLFHNDISEKLMDLRRQIMNKTGFIFPLTRFLHNMDLQENQYVIKIMGKTVYEGYVIPNAKDATEEIIKNLEKIILNNFDTLLTNNTVENYLNHIEDSNPRLVCNTIRYLTLGDIKKILVEILNEGKSIKNITYIFEKINENMVNHDGVQYIPQNPVKIANKICHNIM